jgi:hypothetical protein
MRWLIAYYLGAAVVILLTALIVDGRWRKRCAGCSFKLRDQGSYSGPYYTRCSTDSDMPEWDEKHPPEIGV